MKRKVWKQIDEFVTSDDTILASSTSSMPASTFTNDLKHKSQCIVCHPVSTGTLFANLESSHVAGCFFRPILHFTVLSQVRDENLIW